MESKELLKSWEKYFQEQRESNLIKLINDYDQFSSKTYIEPFVGGASVISQVSSNRVRIGCDINESLIMLLKEVRDGVFNYPEFITREKYDELKNDPNPSALKAFVGFGCSFAGKWFGGYAEDKIGRNYTLNAANSLKAKAKGLKGVVFGVLDYRELNPEHCLIYCDPPYKNTTRIYNLDFDSEEFWDVARKWSKNNIVVISEYEAPEDFECVASFNTKTDIRGKQGRKLERVEKLFMKGN